MQLARYSRRLQVHRNSLRADEWDRNFCDEAYRSGFKFLMPLVFLYC